MCHKSTYEYTYKQPISGHVSHLQRAYVDVSLRDKEPEGTEGYHHRHLGEVREPPAVHDATRRMISRRPPPPTPASAPRPPSAID
jgi:hypothetical protein